MTRMTPMTPLLYKRYACAHRALNTKWCHVRHGVMRNRPGASKKVDCLFRPETPAADVTVVPRPEGSQS